MTTIDSLANETLIDIMDLLKAPAVDRDHLRATPGRYDNLRAAALVCSRWRDPAQRALFDEVDLSGLFLRRFDCFVTSPAQLRYQTRSLCASEGAEWLDVLRVAEKCDRLQSLTCKSLGAEKNEIEWNDLARPCFAGLQHITIWRTRLIGEPLEPSRSLPSLPALSLWTIFHDADAAAFLGDLAKSSKDSLKTLHLRIGDSGRRNLGALRVALGDVAQSLPALALEMSSTLLESYTKIFPVFGALKSFSWDAFDPDRSLNARDVATLPLILDSFPSPSTLRHLSIGTGDFASLEHISTILSHPTMSLLANLDFPYLPPFIPADVEQARRFISMAEACEQRGIQWRLGRN